MTDRIKGFIVTLNDDVRDDDVEPILTALQMVRCVADVSPLVANIDDHMARSRVRSEVQRKIYDAIEGVFER